MSKLKVDYNEETDTLEIWKYGHLNKVTTSTAITENLTEYNDISCGQEFAGLRLTNASKNLEDLIRRKPACR